MKITRVSTLVAISALLLSLTSCRRPDAGSSLTEDSNEVPKLPETPPNYPVSTNDHLANLGRVLFYDKELSANRNVSCGSCHEQQHAFADGKQFSKGTDNEHTKRNSPSIFPKGGRLFWDGRVNSLQQLIFRPIRDKVEMNSPDVHSLVERITKIDYYAFLFSYAFPYAKKIDTSMVSTAVSEFLRNFNFSNTRFSRNQRGAEAFTPSEELGRTLFFGEAKCAQCHHIEGSNFPGNTGGGYGNTNESHNIGLDINNPDLGVGAITHNTHEEGAFMMPVLLNVEFTSPYMHDGRFKTLEEVVDHYNDKVKDNPNLDPILRTSGMNGSAPQKLNLTQQEKDGLVAFLKTLTDPSIMTDPMYSNPFVPR